MPDKVLILSPRLITPPPPHSLPQVELLPIQYPMGRGEGIKEQGMEGLPSLTSVLLESLRVVTHPGTFRRRMV